MSKMRRRAFLVGLPLALGGCAPGLMDPSGRPVFGAYSPFGGSLFDNHYAALEDDGHLIPAVSPATVDPAYMRARIAFDGPYEPGSVVVDPTNAYLYFVEGGGSAIRYGVGVGRQGFGWSGNAVVRRKAHWPTWTPPAEMVARDPHARPFANGMKGGLDNPLGARAMYLYQGDRDTLYRLHGTNEPDSIGKHVSSGCIRLINQDVIDLYNRVSVGTHVTVLGAHVA